MFKKLTVNLNLKYDAGQTVQGQTKKNLQPKQAQEPFILHLDSVI